MNNGSAMNEKMEFRQRIEAMSPEARIFALAELVYDVNITITRVDKKLEGVCEEVTDHATRITALETAAGISTGKVAATGGIGGIVGAAVAWLITWLTTRGG
ncbi:MAG: hypothetical protein PHS93_10030 [Candidatus Omnitrophica bacterium]|nr:hypothetical protein [Candidatus Omnitrophota bacterium]